MIKRSLLPIVIFLVSLACSANGQDNMTTKGDCSPEIKGDSNTVTVVCSDKKQASELKQLLQKLLSSQISTPVLMQHLDDIEKGVARCGDRRLTAEQVTQFKRALGPGQDTVFIMKCETRISDSCEFSQDFIDVMTSAGWKAGFDVAMSAGSELPMGLVLLVNPVDAHEGKTQAASQFLHAAHEIGIDFNSFHSEQVQRGQVEVIFGRKQ